MGGRRLQPHLADGPEDRKDYRWRRLLAVRPKARGRRDPQGLRRAGRRQGRHGVRYHRLPFRPGRLAVPGPQGRGLPELRPGRRDQDRLRRTDHPGRPSCLLGPPLRHRHRHAGPDPGLPVEFDRWPRRRRRTAHLDGPGGGRSDRDRQRAAAAGQHLQLDQPFQLLRPRRQADLLPRHERSVVLRL